MKIITDQALIEAAQLAFSSGIKKLSRESRNVSLGFQGGYLDEVVEWIPELNLWARFGLIREGKSPGNRYWNVFGIGPPTGNTSINCEINPPIKGRNRRTGGVYLVDHHGNYHVGHQGNFNARGRIPNDFVFTNFDGQIVLAQDGEKEALVIMIGQLGTPTFQNLLTTFVLESIKMKSRARKNRSHANT